MGPKTKNEQLNSSEVIKKRQQKKQESPTRESYDRCVEYPEYEEVKFLCHCVILIKKWTKTVSPYTKSRSNLVNNFAIDGLDSKNSLISRATSAKWCETIMKAITNSSNFRFSLCFTRLSIFFYSICASLIIFESVIVFVTVKWSLKIVSDWSSAFISINKHQSLHIESNNNESTWKQVDLWVHSASQRESSSMVAFDPMETFRHAKWPAA